MILKASQRGGGAQLAKHLMNAQDNEHIELHEIRGFIADDVCGAFKEAYGVSRGTKCRQYLFSVSLSPPQDENVRLEVFEGAINAIEERNGLSGQPRVIVFHEKEGRRHCHAVWSRIDAEEMKAVNLPFFKSKLKEISRKLYLENGWKMPKGLMDSKAKDPLNYTLEEYSQAKRMGRNARDLKKEIRDCWAVSDSKASFEAALKERGLFLAKGDRRGHVILSADKPDEVLSVARYAGQKGKEVRARLGKPDDLNSIEETQGHIAKAMTGQLGRLMDEAREKAARDSAPLERQRLTMKAHHASERQKLDAAQKQRWTEETKARATRLNSGLRGLWQAMTGKRKAIQKQNELEAFHALQRDREQRQALLQAHLQERQRLQLQIQNARQAHAKRIAQFHKDMAGIKPRLAERRTPEKQSKPSEAFSNAASSTQRLQKLRDNKTHIIQLQNKNPDLTH